MKLRLRLLILVLLAAVPVRAIQVQDILQDREQRKAAIAEQALDLARLAAAQQDQFIESARYLLAAAAQLPELQNLDRDGCSARMRELLEQFPTITGSTVSSACAALRRSWPRPICGRKRAVPRSNPPYFEGFGSVILERGIAHELGGNTEIHHQAGGVRCDIRIPLRPVAR
jgi:hypothetical protein